MNWRPLHLVPLALAAALVAAEPASVPGTLDPLALPADAARFAQNATRFCDTDKLKLQALLRAIFASKAGGGMGLVYENDRTRTVEEVWKEGRANCLSLTAFFVSACRSLGIRDQYAEVLNTSHWRRDGAIIRFERHVVALTPMPPRDDLVADFVPEIRKHRGTYVVDVLTEARFLALYYSNRSVEKLQLSDLPGAREEARRSLDADPKGSVGWNILGVVEASCGNLKEAEEAYRKAMALDARDGAPIGNLEALLHRLGREEEAQTYRRLGEKVRTRDPYFHALLAEEALQKGDLVEAETRVQAALRILPKEPDFRILFARIHLAEGDFDSAIKDIKEAQRQSAESEHQRYEAKMEAVRSLRDGSAAVQPQEGNAP